MCFWLYTTSVHNTTQNSSDNLPSYLQTTIKAQLLPIVAEEPISRKCHCDLLSFGIMVYSLSWKSEVVRINKQAIFFALHLIYTAYFREKNVHLFFRKIYKKTVASRLCRATLVISNMHRIFCRLRFCLVSFAFLKWYRRYFSLDVLGIVHTNTFVVRC